jgi:ComF family protein
VLCPVPLHWTRAWERGFNQAFLLAEHVGYVCGWEAEELLVRSRPTGRQARRTTGDRRRALREAFTVRSPIVAPPHVILLDDVATSGATLTACAQALRDAGAQRVQALVVAVG